MAVPAGGSIGFSERDNWSFPAGTVFIKHFGIDTPAGLKRLETRFLIITHHALTPRKHLGQALMTGTEAALFDSLAARAQSLHVSESNGISQVSA